MNKEWFEQNNHVNKTKAMVLKYVILNTIAKLLSACVVYPLYIAITPYFAIFLAYYLNIDVEIVNKILGLSALGGIFGWIYQDFSFLEDFYKDKMVLGIGEESPNFGNVHFSGRGDSSNNLGGSHGNSPGQNYPNIESVPDLVHSSGDSPDSSSNSAHSQGDHDGMSDLEPMPSPEPIPGEVDVLERVPIPNPFINSNIDSTSLTDSRAFDHVVAPPNASSTIIEKVNEYNNDATATLNRLVELDAGMPVGNSESDQYTRGIDENTMKEEARSLTAMRIKLNSTILNDS